MRSGFLSCVAFCTLVSVCSSVTCILDSRFVKIIKGYIYRFSQTIEIFPFDLEPSPIRHISGNNMSTLQTERIQQ